MGTTNELADSDVELERSFRRFTNEIIIIQNKETTNSRLDFEAVTKVETLSTCNAMRLNLDQEPEHRQECNTQQLVATSLINDASNDHGWPKNPPSSKKPLENKSMERSFTIIAKETGDFSRHSIDENKNSSPFLPESDMKEFGHKLRTLNRSYGNTDMKDNCYAFGSEVFDEKSPCFVSKHDSSVNGLPVVAFGSQQDIVNLYQGKLSTSKRTKSSSSFGSQVEIDMQGIIQIPFRQNSSSSSFMNESNPENIFPFYTDDSEDEVFSDTMFVSEDPFQCLTALDSEDLSDTKSKNSGNFIQNSTYFDELAAEDSVFTPKKQPVKVTDLDALFMEQKNNFQEDKLKNQKENKMEEQIPDGRDKEETSFNEFGEISAIPITPRKTKRTSNLNRLSVHSDGSIFFEVEDIIIPKESTRKKMNIHSFFVEDFAKEDEIIPVVLVTEQDEFFRDSVVYEQVLSEQVEDVSQCDDASDMWNFFDSSADQTDNVVYALNNMPANDDKSNSNTSTKIQAGFDITVGGSYVDNFANHEDGGFSINIPDGKAVGGINLQHDQDLKVVDLCEVVDCDKDGGGGVEDVEACRSGDDLRHVVEDGEGVVVGANDGSVLEEDVTGSINDVSGDVKNVDGVCEVARYDDDIEDERRGVIEDVCFVADNGDGIVENADGAIGKKVDGENIVGNDDEHCEVVENIRVAFEDGKNMTEDDRYPENERNDYEVSVPEETNTLNNGSAGKENISDETDGQEDQDFTVVVTIDAKEDKRTDNVTQIENGESCVENSFVNDQVVYPHVHGSDGDHGKVNIDVVCQLEVNEKFALANDDNVDDDVKRNLEISAQDDAKADEDVKHDDTEISANHANGGEIHEDKVVDDSNNLKNVDDTRNDVTIPNLNKDDHRIIIVTDSLNMTDDTKIDDIESKDTCKSSIDIVETSNQDNHPVDNNCNGKEMDASPQHQTNVQSSETLGKKIQKIPDMSPETLSQKESKEAEKMSEDFNSGNKKLRKKDRLPKQTRKFKGSKSTKKSGKKSKNSRSSKDEEKPKLKDKSLGNDSTPSRNSEKGLSLDERNSKSNRESLGKPPLRAGSSNSELSLAERITNVNRSIDWVRKVLMEMRAQDLNLKIQFDGLRQEIRTLKEEYDEYVNCEYYEEEELRNIEYLNYKTEGEKSHHTNRMTCSALREDSGYHSDTSSVSDPKEQGKGKGTNCTKARYSYQPVPSFPKVQTLKSSNCVFEIVL